MTDDDTPDPKETVDRIIDGTPIISLAQKAAAQYFENAFGVLEGQVTEIVKKNQQDQGLGADVDQLTQDLINQLRKQVKQIFPQQDDEASNKD